MPSPKKKVWLIVFAALIVIGLGSYVLLDRYKWEVYEAALNYQLSLSRLEKHEIEAGGFKWSYYENDLRGKKPTLICVHGFAANKENWVEFTPYLKDDFHLILVDLPGHGETSFDPSKKYNFPHMNQQLRSFTEALKLDKFHLIGNSLGGGLVNVYAANFPEQVLSVISLSPAGIFDVKSEYQELLEQGKNPLLVNNAEDLDFVMGFAFAKKRFIPWPIKDVILQLLLEKRPNMDRIFADFVEPPDDDFDYKTLVSSLRVPSLIIWGKLDRLINVGNTEVYQQLNPKIQIETLDNVGHGPMLEVPELTADMVKHFVQNGSL